jgi:hypothetical protein
MFVVSMVHAAFFCAARYADVLLISGGNGCLVSLRVNALSDQ